jgi:hypothetical protein
MSTVLIEIDAECVRLESDLANGGVSLFIDGTGGGGRRTWLELARNSCDRAAREGRVTFAHALDAASAEVLAETTDIRKSLVRLAALCVKWIETIDRRGMKVGDGT